MANRRVDLTGKRFGRLVVASLNRSDGKALFWDCVCDCGGEKVVRGESLKSGGTSSCGCLAREHSLSLSKSLRGANGLHPGVIDIKGQRFGRWTAIEFVGKVKGVPKWKCRCDCGTERLVWSVALRSGTSKSCGCFNLEALSKRQRTHGASDTLLYDVWVHMIQRCTNPNHKSYAYYGGRGIKVCDRWRRSFKAFVEDMGQRPSDELSIDRIDCNGNYEPGNCRWATSEQQSLNRRNAHLLTYQGRTQPLSAWAKEFGMPRDRLKMRLKLGWPLEDALTTGKLPSGPPAAWRLKPQ